MKSLNFASIIIPNWNGEQVIESCILSLQKMEFQEFEIIVVDNDSKDESKKILKKINNIKIVWLNKNTGFANAVNEGIKVSTGNYIALLNNDTTVDKLWLSELLKGFKVNDRIGIVTSKLLNFYDVSIIDSAGDTMNIVGQARSRGKGSSSSEFNKQEFVFSATGGASIYKRKVFEEVGLFDPVYYMYFEDADLCYRAQKKGFLVLYQPSAIVYHRHRFSSVKRSEELDYWLFRNFIIFYLVNTPKELFFRRKSILKFCIVVVHTTYYLLGQKKFNSVIKTWIWLILNVKTIIKMRMERKVQLKVKIEYIDSLRDDKIIKIFGFPF